MGCCDSRANQKNPFLEEELKKGIKKMEGKDKKGGAGPKKNGQYKSMSMNKVYVSRQDRQQMQKFYSNNVNQKEVSELNNAYASEDIHTLVSFLNSDVKLKQPLTMPHDWAPPLQSVGTLATELLAELFEDEE